MPEAIWMACPQCGSRFEVRAGVQQEVRCAHCKRRFIVTPGASPSVPPVLTAAPSEAVPSAPISFAPSNPIRPPAASPPADEGDEIRVAPPPERTGFVEHVPKPEEIVERLPPEEFVPPPPDASLSWAMFSGVFEFPWSRGAVSQWIVLSLGLFFTAELVIFAGRAYQAGGVAGVIGAGSMLAAAGFVGMFAYSYAAASMLRIIENTAYNMDAETDWPDVDWRDRFFHLVRVLYIAVLCSLITAAVAWPLSMTASAQVTWLIASLTFLILFPVLLLGMLETNSLSPFSGPVLRSLVTRWKAWGAFYGITLVLGACLTFAATALYGVAGALAPFITEPILAAALFIYARLLGRVAWLLMNEGESGIERPHIRTARDFILARRHERPERSE